MVKSNAYHGHRASAEPPGPATIEEFRVDPAAARVVIRLSGDPAAADLKAGLRQILSNREVPDNVDAVWDLRDVRFGDFDLADVKFIAGIRNAFGRRRSGCRIAVLVSNDLDIHFVKLFRHLLKDHGQQVGIFMDLQTAHEWLDASRRQTAAPASGAGYSIDFQ